MELDVSPDPTSTTVTTSAATGATGTGPSGYSSAPARGKRVATIIAKGGNLPDSARLAELLTEHDDWVKYYSGPRAKDILARATEARQLIKDKRFTPTVERFVNRSNPNHLPEGFVLDAAVRKDAGEVDPLLDEIVGPVADVAAEINQDQLKPLADIITVVHKYGKTRVGKVLVALQPVPIPVVTTVDL